MKKKYYETSDFPEEDTRIRIKREDIKARTGHQEHDLGCGRHDNRPKRKRTRAAQKRDWLNGQY